MFLSQVTYSSFISRCLRPAEVPLMKLIIKVVFPLLVCTMAWAQFPPQLKNVVIIVQENRTPDNLFHFLTPACLIPEGATDYAACTPSPVTSSCYDISPCGLSNQSGTVVPVTLTGARPWQAAETQTTITPPSKKCAIPIRTSDAGTTGPGRRRRVIWLTRML